MTSPPPDLRRFAEESVGPVTGVIDRSWPRDNSSVWELAITGGTRFYLKLHPTALFHEREVAAYRLWAPCLGVGRAAVLVAADASLRSIMITALPGQIARDLKVSSTTEAQIHRQAGILLRRLHDMTPANASHAATDRVAARAGEHLSRASGLIEPQQVRLILKHAARLPAIIRDIPAVPTHGDAQAKNFLWDASVGRLSLIDFERAELGPAVRDLVRLEYGTWDGKPHLREAFIDGYGRQLTAAEETALHSLAALDALSAIQWGTANSDQRVVDRGYRTLARLEAGT